ncbi:MAG: helix-turn-helix domain-containing protein [Proteobacteria bacterium]|nr:helix-turn-helix domain-containing protein [Pseudomonadota bacterium]
MRKFTDIYQDTGCVFYPRCLECPFPLFDGKCLGDASYSVLYELRKVEAQQMAERGMSASQIAVRFDITQRQVERYMTP